MRSNMKSWMNWMVMLCTCTVLCIGSFGCEETRVVYAGAECESDSDCPILGNECFRGECLYPCRGALMCPFGLDGNRLPCNTATGYCVGDPFTPPGYGPETCDGADNDRDGATDEDGVCAGRACLPGESISCNTGLSVPCALGQMRCLLDGSGYSDVCEPPPGSGMGREICDDGIDNNCDGAVDERCICISGDSRPCGPDDVGTCREGTQTCRGSIWSACEGAIYPAAEICGDRLDQNCNNEIDDGCECIPDSTRSCGTDVGTCVVGIETCDLTGRWGDCLGEVGPDSETCDTLDNDCDTVIDEGCDCTNGATQPCGTDLGECSRGIQTCVMGRWGTCVGEVVPVVELCEGLDNNCDGAIDNGCTCTIGASRSCGTDLGACVVGTQTCLNNGFGGGYWGDCGGTYVGPDPEICSNGVDDNCDGFIDNGCVTPTCTTPGSPEICDNGVDDDCDTAVDEGCSGPGRYQHCWTLPATASRVAFEGCSGWAISTGPGDGINGRLVCTRPWSLIAETTGVSSFCFAVSLDSGQYIEYNSVSDLVPDYWGCVGPFPPGTLNGAHTATIGGAPAAITPVDNRLAGCNFRYRRP